MSTSTSKKRGTSCCRGLVGTPPIPKHQYRLRRTDVSWVVSALCIPDVHIHHGLRYCRNAMGGRGHVLCVDMSRNHRPSMTPH